MNKELRYLQIIILSIVMSFLWTSVVSAQYPIYQFTTDVRLSDATWSPDGSLLAVSGEWGIKIFNNELVEVATLSLSEHYTLAVSWNPNGLQLASGDTDGKVRIWTRSSTNSTTFTLSAVIDTMNAPITAVSWSPDSTRIAVLTFEPHNPQDLVVIGVVQIWRWDANNWVLHAILQDEVVTPISRIIWSPDSSMFLGHGGYGYYYIADADTGNILQSDNGSDVTAIAWFEGNKLATSDEGLFTYVMTASEIIPVDLLLAAPIYTALEWSPDGNFLAGGNYGGQIDVWDMSILEIVLHFDSSAEIIAVDWHPNENVLLTLGSNGIIELWDTSSLENIISENTTPEADTICLETCNYTLEEPIPIPTNISLHGLESE